MVKEKVFCKQCEYLPNELQEDLYTSYHCLYVKEEKRKITPLNEYLEAEYAFPSMDNCHNNCPYFKQRKKPFKPRSKCMKILRFLFF